MPFPEGLRTVRLEDPDRTEVVFDHLAPATLARGARSLAEANREQERQKEVFLNFEEACSWLQIIDPENPVWQFYDEFLSAFKESPAAVIRLLREFPFPEERPIAAEFIDLDPETVEETLIIGELSLDGGVRHVKGVLPMAALARQEGYKTVIVPEVDAPEAALIPDIQVIPAPTLNALHDHLMGIVPLNPAEPPANDPAEVLVETDFSEIKGQEHVKRALEVAAAGGHNLLMIGPPGAGKTLMARALPSILPTMTIDEALDVTRIYSVADLLPSEVPLIRARPFRAPWVDIKYSRVVSPSLKFDLMGDSMISPTAPVIFLVGRFITPLMPAN